MLSKLDKTLINTMSDKIYNAFSGEIIKKDDVIEAQQQIEYATDKYSICAAIESMHYCFSIILTEVRQIRRKILTGIFEDKPDLLKEKSVLERKLDAEPEYAKYKEIEEFLFQFIDHLDNVRNNINWLIKEEE